MSEVIATDTAVVAEVPKQTVVIGEGVKARPIQKQQSDADPSLPARTTFQEDLTTAGQRKINLIWEWTQAIIAISVVVISMTAAVVSMVYDKEISAFLSFVCGNVVGFYFSRTNHAAIGGVGSKPEPEYKGR